MGPTTLKSAKTGTYLLQGRCESTLLSTSSKAVIIGGGHTLGVLGVSAGKAGGGDILTLKTNGNKKNLKNTKTHILKKKIFAYKNTLNSSF